MTAQEEKKCCEAIVASNALYNQLQDCQKKVMPLLHNYYDIICEIVAMAEEYDDDNLLMIAITLFDYDSIVNPLLDMIDTISETWRNQMLEGDWIDG